MTIYVAQQDAEHVAGILLDAAHTNVQGEGLVSIAPVDRLYWINTKQEAKLYSILKRCT